jgi:hypothetical protein
LSGTDNPNDDEKLLLKNYKAAVETAQKALIKQQLNNGNVRLYQAQFDVAKYQLEVHLWEKVIKLFPSFQQQIQNDKDELAKAEKLI